MDNIDNIVKNGFLVTKVACSSPTLFTFFWRFVMLDILQLCCSDIQTSRMLLTTTMSLQAKNLNLTVVIATLFSFCYEI